MRTCIGCRARRGAGKLVRVAVGPSGGLVVDRLAPGRGAWLCRASGREDVPEPSCVARAMKRQAFTRALRCQLDEGQALLLLATPGEHASMGIGPKAAPEGHQG